MKLAGAVALVTGGNSGLGKSIAEQLNERGVEVHTCSRSDIEELASSISHHICDVSSYDEVNNLVKKIGNLSILINAAGVWLEGDFYKYTQEDIEKTLDVNLKGSIFACRASIPVMLKNKSGVIVNISSSSGMKAKANETVYAASKWGVRGFTDSLREEFKSSGIRVIGVYPGGMATPFFENGDSPKDNESWMNPNEVSETLVFALEQDESLTIDQLVINRR